MDILTIKGFDHARTAALSASGVGRGKFRLGAVVVSGPHIVSAGYNSYKTHTRLAKVTDYPCLHAETHAMFRAGLDNIADMDLYVVRLGRRGDIRYAKPCDVCQYYITNAGLRNVYYSIDNERYGTI